MYPEKRLELVHFQLTRNCNLRCSFCGQWGRKGFFSNAGGIDMGLDEWKRVVDSLVEYRKTTGIKPSVMLWGGEPLISPYFSEITKYLADNEFELGLITNGVFIDKFQEILKYFSYVSSQISKMYSLKLKLFQKLCNFFKIILLIMFFNIKRLI